MISLQVISQRADDQYYLFNLSTEAVLVLFNNHANRVVFLLGAMLPN